MWAPLPGAMPGASRSSLYFSTAERSSAGSFAFAMKRIRRKFGTLHESWSAVVFVLRIMVRRAAPVGLVHMTDRRVTETKLGPVQPQNIAQHTHTAP